MDTNVLSLFRREAGEDTVIQLDERFEHITSRPRVSRVIPQSETAYKGCEYMNLGRVRAHEAHRHHAGDRMWQVTVDTGDTVPSVKSIETLWAPTICSI